MVSIAGSLFDDNFMLLQSIFGHADAFLPNFSVEKHFLVVNRKQISYQKLLSKNLQFYFLVRLQNVITLFIFFNLIWFQQGMIGTPSVDEWLDTSLPWNTFTNRPAKSIYNMISLHENCNQGADLLGQMLVFNPANTAALSQRWILVFLWHIFLFNLIFRICLFFMSLPSYITVTYHPQVGYFTLFLISFSQCFSF